MKIKSILLLFATFFFAASQSKAQSLQQILDAILVEANKAINAKPSLVNLAVKTIEVNSSSKAYFGNGKTREVFKLELPKGTKSWYYRVTVLDINSSYQYQENETFFHLLSNRKNMDIYAPTNKGVDFFILGHSGDVSSFLQTGNSNFRFYQNCSMVGMNSFTGTCELNQENLWIGIRNPNTTSGLKVIVEVVSLGLYE
ncbi:hypothetical protein [Flaviaesturariibacter amylovorans]|uniref:hypothetical protein n=1 Tax=Flaviaesturariibacter amylovorans TaxID=1084520 RepID=UPI0031F138C5